MPYCPSCGASYEDRVTRCPDCDVELTDEAPLTPDRDAEAREDNVVAYVARDDVEAAMISQVLSEAGIPNTTITDPTHTVFPLSFGKLGSVRVQVLQHNLERAKEIIRSLLAGGSETGPGD